MNVKEWLGEDNQLGIDIWEKKYRFENETFDEWLDRVSNGDKEVRRLILEKKFLFGGRILANRGLQHKGEKITYSNCYVLPSPEDNIESIFDTAKYMARTYSYGGGVGICLDNLRAKGEKVNNAAKTTSGAVSFMRLYNLTTDLIAQNGRRGALMLTMSTNHKDIEEFIDSKNNLEEINKANISIRADNKFMEEAQKKGSKENKLLNKLSANNWKQGEPAILFWDTIQHDSFMSEYDEYYENINPCFTGDMKLLTAEGYKTFEELSGKSVDLINLDMQKITGKVWKSGTKEIVEVKFYSEDFETIKCTPNHIFMLNDGTECEAKDLSKKRLMLPSEKFYTRDLFFEKLGFIQGDGNLARLNSETHKGIEVNIGFKDEEILDLFGYIRKEAQRHFYTTEFQDTLKNLGFSAEKLPNRVMPKEYKNFDKIQKASFLRGCFSANGGVVKGHRVSYKATCKEFIKQLQETLQKDFNITSYITTNKSKENKFKNGTYLCKESYDLNINRVSQIIKFFSSIGFIHEYKNKALLDLIYAKSPLVSTVVHTKEVVDVYDFNEPLTHWGVVNGVVVHNCGELPLPPFGACSLGSFNLSAYVEKHIFDYLEFEADVATITKVMDGIIDESVPLHPLKEQTEASLNYRPIGIGIMGLADMLVKLKIKYGSKQAQEISSTIAETMLNTTTNTSAELSNELGSFKKYDKEKITNSTMFARIKPQGQFNILSKGLRNAQLLTIAPTGSTSTMLGVSGGIEPHFGFTYNRKTESLHGEDKYYEVITPIAKTYMEENNLKSINELPDYFVTSSNITPIDRIKMQSAFQFFIDNSISSTVNLHESATIEDIFNIYVEAYKNNLKGITVFRNNCDRAAILSSTPPTIEQIDQSEDGFTGTTYKTSTGCGNLYTTINNDGKNIVEIFNRVGKGGGCASNTDALARLTALALRSGAEVEELARQIRGIKCSACIRRDDVKVLSCPDAISRLILKEQGKLSNKQKEPVKMDVGSKYECPECGTELTFSEGCRFCYNCSWTKCD